MEGQKKISAVKEELQAAEETMLPSFISKYGEDGRASVQNLVRQAKKKLERLEKERARMETLKQYERQYGVAGYVCGIDEAGRGPLAGGGRGSHIAKGLRDSWHQRFQAAQ